MLEILVLVAMAIIGFFIHKDGKQAGKKEESLDRNEDREGFMKEIADAELEAKRSGVITQRLQLLRDRARKRGRHIGGSGRVPK
jgi:hypothetical protein